MILFLLEDHELPLVRISAVVRTGAAYDPPDKAGLAELTCRAMRTAGTASLTGDEIDDRLDRYAISHLDKRRHGNVAYRPVHPEGKS